jgi:DNA excision repair protein ERCC-4
MHVAIKEGRFWHQIHRLRRSCALAYLLIEGTDLDRGPLYPDSIRAACLAVTEIGVALLRANNRNETALWLRRLALRGNQAPPRDRPQYAQRPKPRATAAVPEAILASVPGISTVCARALLEQFGSVAAVVASGPTEWCQTPGIGPQRAQRLAEAFSFSCLRQEKQAPST